MQNRRLIARLRAEEGVAIASVISLLAIGLLLASAAAVAAMTTMRASVRDHDAKQALAAADAGVEQALFRQNQMLTDETLCVVEDAQLGELVTVTLDVNADSGYCPAVAGSVGAAEFSYKVKPPSFTDATLRHRRRWTVVSTGTADGVTRRVKETAIAPTGEALFGDAGAIGVDAVTLSGASRVQLDPQALTGGAGTNGDVVLESSAELCGSAMYGYGRDLLVSGSGFQCPGFTNGEVQMNLGVPVLPPTAEWQNDRLVNPNTVGSDTVSPASAIGNCGRYCWDPVAKTLDLGSNTTLSLGGGTYVFCDLTMVGNSTLVIASPAATRIYFQDPDDCTPPVGEVNGTVTQFSMTGNSSIVSTSNDPTAAAFLMEGQSDGGATSVLLTGNSKQNEFVIYAPTVDITVTGNSTYVGMMAGKTLSMTGSAVLQIPQTATDFDGRVVQNYRRERYVECAAELAAGAVPDANC